jgi:hypothetical protein
MWVDCGHNIPYDVVMSTDTEVSGTEQVACKRCGRALRSLASRLAEIGPRCAAIEAATAGLKPEQTAKALELISDGGIVPVRKGVYRVTSTDGESVYLTSVSGNCSCAYGLRRVSGAAKTCYHVASARLTARPAIRRALRRNQFAKAA